VTGVPYVHGAAPLGHAAFGDANETRPPNPRVCGLMADKLSKLEVGPFWWLMRCKPSARTSSNGGRGLARVDRPKTAWTGVLSD